MHTSRPFRLLSLALLATPLSLRAQAPAQARIDIDVGQREARVSPLLFGQFMEFMFEDVKYGLHAELLHDRGFEAAPNAIGLPRPWERYPDDRDDDPALNFRQDDSVAYPVRVDSLTGAAPQHALRVDVGIGPIERHGMFQPRIPVRAGVAYAVTLWMKGAGYRGSVDVSLEADASGGRVYAEARVDSVADGWHRYAVVLRPDRGDPLARFAVLFQGRGRVWLDQLSLMPGDTAPGGVRRDVHDLVRPLRPAFIRWPGGNVAQDYDWRWGIGPRDRRPTWVNLSWKHEPEPSDFGTDEFIAFARSVGAEPSLTVNVAGRGATPEEAAAWVEYCNGPATSRYGAMRAANGHPAPYGVELWELGNEIWGDWVRGHSDAATYARNFKLYRDAMVKVDPTIRFIAVGDNDLAWDRTVLRADGRWIDYLAVHHYYGGSSTERDLHHLMAHPLAYERFYHELQQLVHEEVPGHDVALDIDEWGLSLPEAREHGMDAALYAARLMNVFERTTPFVGMTAVSDLVNGWQGGIIQASRTGTFVTPVYHVNRMYATHVGAERVHAAAAGPGFGVDDAGRPAPALDVVATRAGEFLYVNAVNTDPTHALRTRISVAGAAVRAAGSWELLAEPARGPHTDSFAAPAAIAPRTLPLHAGTSFVVQLPARSVSVFTLRLR